MDLSVKDAARLLEVSEKTVYRWISKGELPAYRDRDQYRMNRLEILDWASTRRRPIRTALDVEPKAQNESPVRLLDALRQGGIYYRVEGRTPTQVLRSAIALPGIPDDLDREALFEILSAREKLASTAVGKGIALPHPRRPLPMIHGVPTVLLCFLDCPVDFNALDGQPVHTIFLLLSPTVQSHLRTLARIGFVMHDRKFQALIHQQSSREEILRHLEHLEPDTHRVDGKNSAQEKKPIAKTVRSS